MILSDLISIIKRICIWINQKFIGETERRIPGYLDLFSYSLLTDIYRQTTSNSKIDVHRKVHMRISGKSQHPV